MGTGMASLTVLPPPVRTVLLTGKPQANVSDTKPLVNIGSCGNCRSLAYPPTAAATAAAEGVLTPMPCVPSIVGPWFPGKLDYLLQGPPALLKSDHCQCAFGGTISLINDGQTPSGPADMSRVPREDFDKPITKEKAQEVLGLQWDKYTEEEKDRIVEMAENMPGQLDTFQKIKKAENCLALEKALGITRGDPMTTEEADKQNANPNHSYEYIADPNGTEVINGVRASKNPNYDRQYSINCATCSAAYALRRLGFDVTAKGKTPGSLNEWLSQSHSFDIWNNADGTKAQPTLASDWMQSNNVAQMTDQDYKKYFEETCKEEGIYIVTVKWKEKEITKPDGTKELVSSGAHATVLQRDKDGTLYYIEPQVYRSRNGADGRQSIDNLIYNSNGDLKLTPNPPSEKGIMRVDDKLFDTNYVSLFNT